MTIKPSKTLRINIVQGNITQQFDCDGVVNSANEYLIAGSGVCGAIHKAAGRELETYCKTFAPLGLGEALLPAPYATAGDLPIKTAFSALRYRPLQWACTAIPQKMPCRFW